LSKLMAAQHLNTRKSSKLIVGSCIMGPMAVCAACHDTAAQSCSKHLVAAPTLVIVL
jgi:hypothetical protein